MEQTPILELDAVGVTIEGGVVLADITWMVAPGQHWVVIGPNGGGKSTMLRVASLQLYPTMGTVRVLGHEFGRVDIRPLRARIGLSSAALVDQLRGNLTAQEIVRCGRFAALEPWWHRYDDSDHQRAEQMLVQVGLDDFGSRRFVTLSSGERQRVMLARTLMPDPELVLLDEPTAGLDFGAREELLLALSAMADHPGSPPTVLVTHRVEDIPPSATHLLAIADGKSVAAGPIDTTLNGDLMTRLFGLPVELARSGQRWTARAV